MWFSNNKVFLNHSDELKYFQGSSLAPPPPPLLYECFGWVWWTLSWCTLRWSSSWTWCCRVRLSCCFWNSAKRSCFWIWCCCCSRSSSCCSWLSLAAGSTTGIAIRRSVRRSMGAVACNTSGRGELTSTIQRKGNIQYKVPVFLEMFTFMFINHIFFPNPLTLTSWKWRWTMLVPLQTWISLSECRGWTR